MKHNLISLACYLGLGVATNILAPGEWDTGQVVAYFVMLGLVLIIDIRSYRDGRDRGVDIANEILHEMCKEKKIKVVRNA